MNPDDFNPVFLSGSEAVALHRALYANGHSELAALISQKLNARNQIENMQLLSNRLTMMFLKSMMHQSFHLARAELLLWFGSGLMPLKRIIQDHAHEIAPTRSFTLSLHRWIF